jgi:hypothetical protein
VSLADQIINHEPWGDQLASISATGTELNELRDELLELRRLRAAAEVRERFEVGAIPEPYRPPHPTCVEVTQVSQLPRREWICGWGCPTETGRKADQA